jgi:PAS domain S-box-containing protein
MSGDQLSFLSGGGEVAGLIGAFDWGSTPLGPISAWPPALRAGIATALRAPVPVALLLGPDAIMVYNDRYIPIAGRKHPASLGASAFTAWPEVAEFNARAVRTVLAGGSLSYRDHELMLLRNGVEERVWFNLDYSPLPDPDGRPVGVWILITETTDKVRFERAVVDERERLRQMFEQAPSFMALLGGPEHVFELANAAYRQLIGHRDVVGLAVREALPDVEGQGFYELLDEVYATGEPYLGRGARVLLQAEPHGAAEERLLDFLYQPVRDATGAVSGIFVEGIDITDRLRADRAREASELQFRALAESMPNHVWAALPDGGLEWMNGRMLDYSGLPAAALVGDGWKGMVHPDECDEVTASWGRSVEMGEPFEIEQRLRAADGSWRWHLTRAVLMRDDTGRPRRWIGTSTDIEDRKRGEQALRDSELRLRLSQEAAGIASLEVDVSTDEVMGTDALWSLWGLPPARSVPVSTLENLVVREDRALCSSAEKRLTGTAEPSVEYRIRRADNGEERWIARHVEFQRDATGKPVRMFGVMRDVTAPKQTEIRQQLLTHELEHRIKNILATVSAIASQTLRDTDLATARGLFDQRLQALGRAHDLLNRTRWTAASLGNVVAAALAPFAREQVQADGPELLIGPRRALSLALAVNELGTNAVKYGALSCESGRVTVGWERSGTDAGAVLVWSWTERGGPEVVPPERRGFGRFLLERVLAADFCGSVRIEFAPGGVRFVLTCPWPMPEDATREE